MRVLLPSYSVRRVRSALVLTALGLLAGTARADIDSVNMFRSNTSLQTGNGNTLTNTGSFFTASLISSNANDFSAVQMVYPGAGSPVNLNAINPTTFFIASNTFPTQALMDADYPMGTYTFNATGTVSDSTNFSYTSDDYGLSTPFLTGTDYAALQGLNAGSAFTFHFNPFTTGGKANESFLFFTIFDQTTNALVYDAGFLPATTSSLTLSANALQASHSYTYELIFSNRDSLQSSGANFNALIGFDLRTRGDFRTAATTAPEPGSLALLLPVLGMVGMRVRRLRRKRN